MTTPNDISNRTLTLKRTFNAPVALVWEAWTQSEHIARWWAPKHMSLSIVQHDFQVGGKWEYTMKMPNGQNFQSYGAYLEIQKPERIHTSANFIPMTVGVELQAHFADAGAQTEFTFHVIHETEEYCRQQEEMGFMQGWGSVFENLAAYLLEMGG